MGALKTAMVFAAGQGKRMQPLTLHRPKPLLKLAGQTLLARLLYKIESAGIEHTIVNAAYLSEQIVAEVQSLPFSSMHCTLSLESEPLETGGALVKALPLLGSSHILLCNSDVWIDYPMDGLVEREFDEDVYAHLVLVPNPSHNPAGDFVLRKDSTVAVCEGEIEARYTFSGVSVVHPNLVRDYAGAKTNFPLRELLYDAIKDGRVTGELYNGQWLDIGTPERWRALQDAYGSQS